MHYPGIYQAEFKFSQASSVNVPTDVALTTRQSRKGLRRICVAITYGDREPTRGFAFEPLKIIFFWRTISVTNIIPLKSWNGSLHIRPRPDQTLKSLIRWRASDRRRKTVHPYPKSKLAVVAEPSQGKRKSTSLEMRLSQRIGMKVSPVPLDSQKTDAYRDRSLTLTQNYKRLGLSSRLNAPTGGVEKKITQSDGAFATDYAIDPLAIKPNKPSKLIKPREARVERDPETGKILRVISDDDRISNPLNDPLNAILSSPEPEGTADPHERGVVSELEAQARAEEQQIARTKRPRQQSKREEEWIQRLVHVHGEDYRAMSRDMKLNAMQQSEGDIKRRVQRWLQNHQTT